MNRSNMVSVNEPDAQLKENQLSKVSVDNGWYISISFGKSSSQNFDRALFLAKSAPKYEELEYNNNPVYQATYSEKPDDFLAFVKLYEMIKSWKSTTVIINGRMIDRKIVGSLNYCYGDRCRSGKPDFCFGASYMTQNPFGCHRLQISACNNPWWSFNHFNGNKYILDKNAIKNRIEQYGDNYKICPCYNEQYIYAVLNSLPNELTTKEYNKLMSGTQLNFSINLDTPTSLVDNITTQQSIDPVTNVKTTETYRLNNSFYTQQKSNKKSKNKITIALIILALLFVTVFALVHNKIRINTINTHIEEGNYQKAEEMIDDYQYSNPTLITAYELYAELYLAKNEPQMAIDKLKQGVDKVTSESDKNKLENKIESIQNEFIE